MIFETVPVRHQARVWSSRLPFARIGTVVLPHETHPERNLDVHPLDPATVHGSEQGFLNSYYHAARDGMLEAREPVPDPWMPSDVRVAMDKRELEPVVPAWARIRPMIGTTVVHAAREPKPEPAPFRVIPTAMHRMLMNRIRPKREDLLDDLE